MKVFLIISIFFVLPAFSQTELYSIKGKVSDEKGLPVAFASVALKNTIYANSSDANGSFEITSIPAGNYLLSIRAIGFENTERKISVPLVNPIKISLIRAESSLNEVVITGTMKEIQKDDSPINVDIVTPKLFQKTSTANLFEATGLVNGVKPQINCNVCNTGDIHINGMEGPYTLILIDGMPIVSGLSTVYGLMGIPASMIERMEIAKGPAGALYGSEAMGGTINVITKKINKAPKFYMDYYGTTYLENNLDLSTKMKLGKKANYLVGMNTYWYDHKMDINSDGFTDVTLQKRISLFNKISIDQKQDKEFTLAARYVYEDRWGGQMNYEEKFRGGDSIYGESIYVNRLEFISKYEWPLKEKIVTQVSYNYHDQNSVYGLSPFMAKQSTAFAQTYWTKKINLKNDFLSGLAYKNLWFDDNTFITQSSDGLNNNPDNSNTFGLFLQNETTFDSASKYKLLAGLRLDYHSDYNLIPSPRLAFKWTPNHKFIFRLNAATGFRIVNVFTEDHMALTGARDVVFVNEIKPETSYNASINLIYKMKLTRSSLITWDATVFYYHFLNKIYANYDLDPNKVIYDNLNGYAFSRGASLSAVLANIGRFKFNIGVTYANVQNVTTDSIGNEIKSQQLQSPLWSGNIIATYTFPKQNVNIDLTANWYGPQRLPILPNDYRAEYSPWFMLLNLQVSKTLNDKFAFYAGVKNVLNFLPKDPIMRPNDPFDKTAGDINSNPNGYTFDPSYNYAPMQGIRAYIGLRITLF